MSAPMSATLAQIAESSSYLLAQNDWYNCPWKPRTIASEAELRNGGAKLAGWGRDISGLSPDERVELLKFLDTTENRLSREQQARLSELHERAPFTHHRVPFLDLDANEKHPEFTRERAINTSLVAARALTKACREVGLGTPRWAISNLNGGLHGRLKLPPIPPSNMLSLALLKLVREASKIAQIPLLLDYASDEARGKRPIIVLDDGLFNRKASGRGVMWRIEQVKKPGADKVYIPVELGESGPPTPLSSWEQPEEADACTIINVCRELEAEDEVRRAAEKERREAAKQARLEREQQKAAALARGEVWEHGSEWPEAWLDAVIDNHIEEMATASQGNRNYTLNKVAYTFGGLEAGGAFEDYHLSADEVRQRLIDAAVEAGGHSPTHIASVLKIGWQRGSAKPASPPPERRSVPTSGGGVVITTENGRQVRVRFGKKKKLTEVELSPEGLQAPVGGDARAGAWFPRRHGEGQKGKKSQQQQKKFLEEVQGLVQPQSPIWKAARRAKLCRVYRNVKKCKGCNGKLGRILIEAENAFCLHCSKKYLEALETALAFSKKHLADTVAVASVKFDEADRTTVGKHRDEIKKWLDKAQKGLASRVRFVPSPSEILFYALPEDAPLIDRAGCRVRVMTRKEAARAIRLVVQKRRKRIMDYFEREDAAGLVADEWTKEFVATSAGKVAKKTLPWPNAKEIREACRELRRLEKGEAADDLDPKVSKCCGAPILYQLERGGKKLDERGDRMFGMTDVEKRADT